MYVLYNLLRGQAGLDYALNTIIHLPPPVLSPPPIKSPRTNELIPKCLVQIVHLTLLFCADVASRGEKMKMILLASLDALILILWVLFLSS